MRDFSLEIRRSTPADVRQCDGAPDYLGNSEDGFAAILMDGELLAVTDEYGTAHLRAGSNFTPTKEQLEAFNEAAMNFYAEALP